MQSAQGPSDTGQPPTRAGAAAAIFALHCLHELQPLPKGGMGVQRQRRVRAYLLLPALRSAVALLSELPADGPSRGEVMHSHMLAH